MTQQNPARPVSRFHSLVKAFGRVALIAAVGCTAGRSRQDATLSVPANDVSPCEKGDLTFAFESNSAPTLLGFAGRGVFSADQSENNAHWNELYGRHMLLMGIEGNAASFARWLAPVEHTRGKSTMEKAVAVDAFIDTAIRYAGDDVLYGKKDHWASPVEAITKRYEKDGVASAGWGDCEDITILKYFALRHLGVPADSVFIVFVRDRDAKAKDPSHMFLMLDVSEASGDRRYVVLNNDSIAYMGDEAEIKKTYLPYYAMNEKGFYAFPDNSVPRWQAAMPAPAVCLPPPRVGMEGPI